MISDAAMTAMAKGSAQLGPGAGPGDNIVRTIHRAYYQN